MRSKSVLVFWIVFPLLLFPSHAEMETDRGQVLVDTLSQALQITVSKNVGSRGAAVINSAISEYLGNPESSMKSASYKALMTAVDEYIKDPDAKAALTDAVSNARAGKKVETEKVGAALLKSGVLSAIDKSNLSETEKSLAKAAVAELSGKEGSLQKTSMELFRKTLIKNGFSKEKAETITASVQTFVSDTTNTTALKSAVSIALQDTVSRNVGSRGAAVINSAISEYLDNPESSMKSASYKALMTAVDEYIKDPEAKAALTDAVSNAEAGKKVEMEKVGAALLKSGVLSAIDKSNLSEEEKALARAAVAELSGKEGSLQKTSMELFRQALLKNGFSEEKAEAITASVQTFVSDTTNTTALKSAVSIALQETVSQNIGSREAAVINSAISEYLDKTDSTGKSAAYAALLTAVNEYITDPDAKDVLTGAVHSAQAGQEVDATAVGKALLQGGINTYLDQTNLTDTEKAFAKTAVREILGSGGDLTTTGTALLKEKLMKNGFSETKAELIASQTVLFLSNPREIHAAELAAATALQEVIAQYVDPKQAGIINAAINDYLVNKDSDLESMTAAALENAVDQSIRDEASREALKQSIEDFRKGKEIDALALGTTFCKAGLNDLIDHSNLSDDEKNLLKGIIEELSGEEGALLNATSESLETVLKEHGVSEDLAKTIADSMQQYLADTGNTAALQNILSESLQDLVSQYVSAEGSGIINAAIRDYLSAEGTPSSSALAALNAAIDQYITDETAKQQLKAAVSDLKAGKEIDPEQIGTALFRGSLNALIDQSGLSETEKALAKGVVNELSGEDGALTNAGLEALQEILIKAGLSKEDAETLVSAFKEYINGTDPSFDSVIDCAKTIFSNELAKTIDKQLMRLSEKYPFLGELFRKWGINGDNIADFIMNLSVDDIRNAFEKVVNMSWEDWKDFGRKLFEKVADFAMDPLLQYAEKWIDEQLEKLLEKAMAELAKLKALDDYLALIAVAGSVVTDTVSSETKEILNSTTTRIKKIWSTDKE